MNPPSPAPVVQETGGTLVDELRRIARTAPADKRPLIKSLITGMYELGGITPGVTASLIKEFGLEDA